MIPTLDITGLVLAGGQGRRMGGVDKGLQPLPTVGVALPDTLPLARHALARLAPQVGRLALSVNRNLDTYGAWGVPVWPDLDPGLGPLSGLATGLAHAGTGWVATVPCDAPRFPLDLVTRLAETVQSDGARAAVAWSGGRVQPVFSLVHRDLTASLQAFLACGGRRAQDWLVSVGAHRVDFDRPGLDDGAFFNVNTPEDLQALAQRQASPVHGAA